MTEEGFLRVIIESPDEATRLIYADWLDERDDVRGQFLRLESAIAQLPSGDERRHILQGRLSEVGSGLDPEWVATVSRVPIEGCGVSFRFRCPKQWERLTPTADRTVRFCEGCRREVFFCSTLSVAQTHAAVGDCIAVDSRLLRRDGDLASNFWELDSVMGLPDPDESGPPAKDEDA